LLARSARHSESAGGLGAMSSKSRPKTAGDARGTPDRPHGGSGQPQRVDGARRNPPPTAFCFESDAVNTGEPGREVQEGGQEASESPTQRRRPPGRPRGPRSLTPGKLGTPGRGRTAQALRERVGQRDQGTQRTRTLTTVKVPWSWRHGSCLSTSLAREPDAANVSRPGLTGGLGRRAVR
jgi:hypothetical protein